jgi:hypothetical protein
MIGPGAAAMAKLRFLDPAIGSGAAAVNTCTIHPQRIDVKPLVNHDFFPDSAQPCGRFPVTARLPGRWLMACADETILDELDALWRVRFGQPLPVLAEPEVIIRVMRMVEEKRLAQASREAASPA